MDGLVLFHASGTLKVGDLARYTIEYTPDPAQERRQSLWVRVRNLEHTAMRAAYLKGPFTLYADMRPSTYDEFSAAPRPEDEPKYENHVKAGQHFSAELLIPPDQQQKRVWTVDVVSEILFSRSASIAYEIIVGTTKRASKTHHPDKYLGADPLASEFKVNVQDTAALWGDQQLTSLGGPLPQVSQKPLHLVVLTHGLVSNVTADMYYLKESIDKAARAHGQNIIVRGYTGNVCRTERGVKYLGRRLGQWIMRELVPAHRPVEMSFVGHSLGGCIQTYALGWIQNENPGFFDNIKLRHFVTMASPLLGISSENPGYVRFALDFGVVGKTGRDLGLSWVAHGRPLLELLPKSPAGEVLRKFRYRTLYANSVHDGIVPLRTSALLYLDWKAIAQASAARHGSNAAHHNSEGSGDSLADTLADLPFVGPASRRKKIISRSQTVASATTDSGSDSGSIGEAGEEETAEGHAAHLPRKTSLIESGMTLLLPPHPDHQFITDPKTREDVIFHDRVYRPSDLPPRQYKEVTKLGPTPHKETVEVGRTEERIARAYHSHMDWRKVLVQLLPDAHNNIVVRRRFSNAYGWPVVHHVADMLTRDDPDDEKLLGSLGELYLEKDQQRAKADTENSKAKAADPERMSQAGDLGIQDFHDEEDVKPDAEGLPSSGAGSESGPTNQPHTSHHSHSPADSLSFSSDSSMLPVEGGSNSRLWEMSDSDGSEGSVNTQALAMLAIASPHANIHPLDTKAATSTDNEPHEESSSRRASPESIHTPDVVASFHPLN